MLWVGFLSPAWASSDSTSEAKADADWQEVISSGPRPARQAGESSLTYFLRDVELANRRRRELGLAFWKQYPSDPRRYRWLLLTVHMPPHYPKDLHEWAENESRLEPNKAAIDARALKRWEDQYVEMRRAFWDSPAVTDEERRFLWFGELEQGILRMREAVARGEPVNVMPVLDGIAEFAETFGSPVSELDASAYHWVTTAPIRAVLENARAFKIEPRVQEAFVERLEATGNQVAFRSARKELEQLGAGNVDPAQGTMSEAERAWQALPEYPQGTTSLFESRIVFWHARNIMTRRYREIGLRLWDEHPDRRQRYLWLFRTQTTYSPYYLQHFVDGIHLLAANQSEQVDVDEAAQQEWNRHYAKLRDALLSDPETTDHERRGLYRAEFSERMRAVEHEWSREKDQRVVLSLLEDIHKLYTRHGYAGLSRYFANEVLRRAPQYGLGEQQLQAFIAPMLEYEDTGLRELAQAKHRLLALRDVAVELEAPTLAGEPFDLKALRGKIVLVDYWATTCSSCIAAMPRIKAVYDRYRERGFEVLSVCFDGKAQRKRVERAEKEMGLTWTTLAADELRPELKRRYGYESVPQYMLLDRQGRLVAETSEIDMGRNLEELLEQMLAKEAAADEPVADR